MAEEQQTIWADIEREWTEYLEEYEMSDGNAGSYKPNENEQGIAIDALAGFLSEDNTLANLCRSAQAQRLANVHDGKGS